MDSKASNVKITGGELVEPAEPTPVLDLVAALQESVRAAERVYMRPSARHRP